MAVPAGVAWAAAAAAVALVLVQAVSSPAAGGDFEIAGSDDLAKMPFVFVTFKPEARMADVTAFLADNGAVIVAGPAAGGVFKIGIPAKTVADYDGSSALLLPSLSPTLSFPEGNRTMAAKADKGFAAMLAAAFSSPPCRVGADQRSEPHRRPTSTA